MTTESDFIGYLHESIESFCRELKKRSPKAFIYRGENFEQAVSIFFYYRLHANENLFKHFKERKPLKREQEPQKGLSFLNFFFDFLEKKKINDFALKKQRNLLHNPLLEAIFSEKLSLIKKLENIKKGSPHLKTIVYITHKKFINMLLPLLNNLDQEYLFLLCYPDSNSELEQELKSKKVPYLNFYPEVIDRRETPLGMMFSKDLLRIFTGACTFFQFFIPDRVIFIEGSSPYDHVVSKAAKKEKIPTVCLQNGSAIIAHFGYRYFSYTVYCSWGKFFANRIRSINSSQEVLETGYFNFPPSFTKKEKDMGSSKAIYFFSQGITRLINQETWDTFLMMTEEVSKSLPGEKIILREHPGHPLSAQERKRLTKSGVTIDDGKSTQISTALQNCKIGVSIYSTVILECIANQVPVIRCKIGGLNSYILDIEKLGLGFEAQSTSELVEVIKRLQNQDEIRSLRENCRVFSKDLYSNINDKNVQERTTRVISSLKTSKYRLQTSRYILLLQDIKRALQRSFTDDKPHYVPFNNYLFLINNLTACYNYFKSFVKKTLKEGPYAK